MRPVVGLFTVLYINVEHNRFVHWYCLDPCSNCSSGNMATAGEYLQR